jgi:hypothetical protein
MPALTAGPSAGIISQTSRFIAFLPRFTGYQYPRRLIHSTFRSVKNQPQTMSTFSSKELYIMNGGNKLYIYKDGFGDVYSATPAEEAEWAQEVVARALTRIDEEKNTTNIKFAVDTLRFHNYAALEALLLDKLTNTTPARQIGFATALWMFYRYAKSFEIILKNLEQHRAECLNDAFYALGDFIKDPAATTFIIACLEGNDEEFIDKANMTIGIWAWSHLPALRENSLLELLRMGRTDPESFTLSIKRLKRTIGLIK